MVETTYILTAELDDHSFTWLDGLRRQHFPPERNWLQAHLTLFHRLSPAQVAALTLIGMPPAAIELCFDRVVFLGLGVAIGVRADCLGALRSQAMTQMGGAFSAQDRQPWKPHVTIQNKAPATDARDLYHSLQTSFVPRAGEATGLLVWEYLGGPWLLAHRIGFGGFTARCR